MKVSQQFIQALEEEKARRAWELSKYTEDELRTELFNRTLQEVQQDVHYTHNVDITSEPFYCSDCEMFLDD